MTKFLIYSRNISFMFAVAFLIVGVAILGNYTQAKINSHPADPTPVVVLFAGLCTVSSAIGCSFEIWRRKRKWNLMNRQLGYYKMYVAKHESEERPFGY